MRPLACLLLCAAVAPAAEPVVTRTFSVAHLVAPLTDHPAPVLGRAPAAPGPVVRRDRAARTADLMLTLTAVAPDAAGWAKLDPAGNALTVTHAPAVVERVVARLAELTAASELSVAVECRVLAVPVGQSIGLPSDGPGVFDPDRLARSLTTAQSHPRTAVLQAPKLTVFDGQRCGLWAGEEQAFVTALESVNGTPTPRSETVRTGTAVEYRPVVAADRRAVALEVWFQQAELDGPAALVPVTHFVAPTIAGDPPIPFTQFVQQPKLARREARQSATVPDGHTLVLPAGRRTTLVETPAGPLARVPYLSRLTTSRQPTTEEVVALLTVRVLPADGR